MMNTKTEAAKNSDEVDLKGTNTVTQRNKNNAILMFSSAISMGTGLGISLGVAFDNIALGLSMGAGIGLTGGAFLYQYFISKTCEYKKD